MDPTPEKCSDGGRHEFDLSPMRGVDSRTLTQEGWCQKCNTTKLDSFEWDGSYEYDRPGSKCTDLFGHSWGDPSEPECMAPYEYAAREACGICGDRRSAVFRSVRVEFSLPGGRVERR